MLAGHRALSTTQRYIEADVEAQRKVVDLVKSSPHFFSLNYFQCRRFA